MPIRRSTAFAIKHVLSIFTSLSASGVLWASGVDGNSGQGLRYDTVVADCERKISGPTPITIQSLMDEAREVTAAAEARAPLPDFIDVGREMNTRWFGVNGPRALSERLGSRLKFVASPAPFAEAEGVVKLLHPQGSIPFHLDLIWNGRPTSTTGWVTLPFPKTAKSGEYLIGPEYEEVVWHMHGGGTPTASGVNGVSIGAAIEEKGIPWVGHDLPFHSRGPRELMRDADELIEHVLQLMETLVHPDVNITVTGHSYGAMIALMMWYRSADPRFQRVRIKRYIPMSPGVETPPEVERELEDNYLHLKDRMAEGDFEFKENMLINGKVAPVPLWGTEAFMFNFRTPRLTPELIQRIAAPMTLIMGSADGIVYVGRERYFEEAFSVLPEGSQVIMLPPGLTFKSKDEADVKLTGHQIFDLQVPGTFGETARHWVYNLIPEIILGRERAARSVAERQKALRSTPDGVLHQYVVNFSNYFAFRPFVNRAIIHKRTITSHGTQLMGGFDEGRNRIVGQAGELREYLTRVERELKKNQPQLEKRKEVALQNLRNDVGLNDQTPLDRARWEVALAPMTDERRQALEHFIAEAALVEEAHRREFQDPVFEQLKAELWREYGAVLRGLGLESVDGYAAHLESFRKLPGKLTKEQDTLRSHLSRLHNAYTDGWRSRQQRYSEALARKLAPFLPSGISDVRTAKRELDVNWAPERREALHRYVERAPAVLDEVARQFDLEQEQLVASLSRPALIMRAYETHELDPATSPVEVARILESEIEAQRDLRYVPRRHPQVALLVSRRARLEQERVAISTTGPENLKSLTSELQRLKEARDRNVRQMAELWGKGEEQLTSPALQQALARMDSALEAYMQGYIGIRELAGDYMRGPYQAGQLTRETILNRPPEIREREEAFRRARDRYMGLRQEVERLRLVEALAGRLQGPAERVAEYQRLAREVLGTRVSPEEFQQTGQSGPDSLNAAIASVESRLEELRRRESLLAQEIRDLEWRYVQALEEAGVPVAFQIHRFVIADMLALGDERLVEELNANPLALSAMQEALKEWDDLWKPRLGEQQLKSEMY